ncbi:hypothetical protein CDQ96_04420 (plasmid) [Borrelia miyamotoi]|uniref:DUF792 family protein n=1 Tax=Borrelia miyamotoi TaxID=47466 RepID=UPI000B8D2289|nr:DUF792 family protein [Borrelia miyamotoi]ASQ29656.1 hypothetical protein CDQ96_04420 [Borrelia miyamotoi]
MLNDITLFILELVNHVLGLAKSSNFIALFPRPDLKGLDYFPQIFFIYPKGSPIVESMSISSSQRSIVNLSTMRSEFINYNVTSNPKIISISEAILAPIHDHYLIENLTKTPFKNSILEFDLNFVKEQFREKFRAGTYYSLYNRSIGFHETAIVSSLRMTNTVFIDEIKMNIDIKIVKTFNYFTYKG